MGNQKGVIVARKRYSAEQIIGHLRQAKILISQVKTIIEAARHLSVSKQTYYLWCKEYGGMEVAQVHRLFLGRTYLAAVLDSGSVAQIRRCQLALYDCLWFV